VPAARAQTKTEHDVTEADGSSERLSAPSGRRRGRRRGIEVRPGTVKQARLEAGLSLGQVAQGDLSRTAIYFVETGKAKPSLETLQLIATRTGKPIDFFLPDGQSAAGDEVGLAEIERLVAMGENAEAVTAVDRLLVRTRDARTAALAKVFLTTALIRLGQPARGRSHALAARLYFEQAGDVLMAAEAQSWEAGCALMLRDPAALGLAQEALEKCRSLKPVPTMAEAKLLAILGHAHTSRHEYAKAIQAYEQATAVGAAFPDLRRLSYIYGNMSLAYQETGKYADAARYAHRAMAIQETLQDTLSISVSENNLALLLLRQGDLEGAFRYAESSLRRREQLGVEHGRANVLATLAELELARANYYAASRWANAALDVATRTGETTNVGEAHFWLGRVAAARDDLEQADAQFNVAFQIFESVDATDWTARAHVAYAEILEARGDLAGANRHLRQALAVAGAPAPSALQAVRIAIA
jgi:tetratricopeptide (TPR) repeat protein/DNA-binding XRE family transcriptional regulator